MDLPACVGVQEVRACVNLGGCSRGDRFRRGAVGAGQVEEGWGGTSRATGRDLNSWNRGGGVCAREGVFKIKFIKPAIVFFHALFVEEEASPSCFSYLFLL